MYSTPAASICLRTSWIALSRPSWPMRRFDVGRHRRLPSGEGGPSSATGGRNLRPSPVRGASRPTGTSTRAARPGPVILPRTTDRTMEARVKSGLEIAQEAELRPITEIAASAGIPDDVLEPFGRYRAKVDLSILDRLADRPDGKLIITTAITPTKAGEGKTTTSISLTQGMGKIGKDVAALPARAVDGTRCSASRAAARAAATRRSSRWRTSTSTSTATSTRSRPPTTCWRRRSTPRSTSGTRWGSTRPASRGRGRSTSTPASSGYTVIGLGGKMHGVPRENGFVITAASGGDGGAGARVRPRRPPRPSRTDRRRVDDGRAAGHRRAAAGRRRDDRRHEGRARSPTSVQTLEGSPC